MPCCTYLYAIKAADEFHRSCLCEKYRSKKIMIQSPWHTKKCLMFFSFLFFLSFIYADLSNNDGSSQQRVIKEEEQRIEREKREGKRLNNNLLILFCSQRSWVHKRMRRRFCGEWVRDRERKEARASLKTYILWPNFDSLKTVAFTSFHHNY